MSVGSRGVLVSCVMGREQQAGREAVAILADAHEALAPPADDAGADAAGDDANAPPADIAAELAAEVAGLKDAKQQPLFWRDVGIPSLVYVEARYAGSPAPSALVAHACAAAKASGQNRARLCKRFYPVDATCASTPAAMAALAAELAAEHFPAGAAGLGFAVDMNRRAAPPALERGAAISIFADAIAQPPHRVRLDDPDLAIVVNLIKGACGAAVVRGFKALAKFNLALLASPEEAAAAAMEAAAAGKALAEAAAAKAAAAEAAAAAAAEGGGEAEPAAAAAEAEPTD